MEDNEQSDLILRQTLGLPPTSNNHKHDDLLLNNIQNNNIQKRPLDQENLIQSDGSFGLITDDVVEHCIFPFVEYRELILNIPLVCSKWKSMTNKQSIWFDSVLRETNLNPINLLAYVNNCKYLCKIKSEKQATIMMNDSIHLSSLSDESLLLSDDVYILKRLLYMIRDYFPTVFLTPTEDDRSFHQPGLISRDSKNPNVLIYNKREAIEEYRAFAYDLNLMTNKRIPNLLFQPPLKSSSEEDPLQTPTQPIIPSTLPPTTTTPPVEKLSSNYLLEDLLPIFYFEVETMVLDKPEPSTPVTPLSSTSTTSANSFWKKITKKKVKEGRNSIGVLHKNYLGNRQIGWDDLSAGFHTDDGGIFLEEGSSKFKVDMPNGEMIVVGDVIGCGFSSYHKAIFFTRNGTFLTSPVKLNTLKEDMRFGLGFWKNMIVKCNFGHESFKYDITKALDDINHYFDDPERFIHHLYDSEMTYSDDEKMLGLVEKLTSLRNRIETANRFLENIQQRIIMRELGIDSDEEMNEEDDNNDEDYIQENVDMELSSTDESSEEEETTWESIHEDAHDQSPQSEQPQEGNISEEEGSFSD